MADTNADTRSPAPRHTAPRPPTPLVALGEIRTCLLPHSLTLDGPATDEVLSTVAGAAVIRRERPGPLAFSPRRATGVDCHLGWGATARSTARAVGTVSSTVVLVGGRIAQLSSHTTVVRAQQKKRMPWSHYITRIGVTEVIGDLPDHAVADKELAAGYFAPRDSNTLDLGSISALHLDGLRSSPLLDQKPPLRAPTTRLRWSAVIGGSAGPAVSLRVEDDLTRTLRVTVKQSTDLPDALRFCQDVAAHDWLLTVIDARVRSAEGFDEGRQVDILAPVHEHLAHLWMPGAQVPASMRTLWRDLQTAAGYAKQWDARVAQIQRRIDIATYYAVRAYGSTRNGSEGQPSQSDRVSRAVRDSAEHYAKTLDSSEIAGADSLNDLDTRVEALLGSYHRELLTHERQSNKLRFGTLYEEVPNVSPNDEEWVGLTPLFAGLIAAEVELRGPVRLSPTQNILLAAQFEVLAAESTRRRLPAHAIRAWDGAMELYRRARNSEAEDRCGLALARAHRRTLAPGLQRGASRVADLLCGYGYRPFRLLGWVVLQIALCTAVALLLAGTKPWSEAAYLGILTFLNPLDPNNVAGMDPGARVLFAVEAWLGVVSMSVFFALLVRRWFRL
ncbi:SCO2521 family protein [Nocardia sp. NPDC060259]|uniref:SCO2521 family protein n=1 Tax=Nocardia sp. NPDC060259 TaxID=3347088 RepID=UPI00364EA9F0